jgi:hypothetical protein
MAHVEQLVEDLQGYAGENARNKSNFVKEGFVT